MQKLSALWQSLILIVVGTSFFFKGLFPAHYQMAFVAVMVLLAAAYLIKTPVREKQVMGALDWLLLALAALSLASAIWGANRGAALQRGLVQVVCYAIYWVVSRSSRSAQARDFMVKGLTVVSTAVAVFAVFTAANWIPYQSAVLENRIAGPFQYPNTMGAFLLCGAGLTLAARTTATEFWERLLWGAAFTVQGTMFIFTYSRIAWAIAPVVAILFVVMAPRVYRMSLLAGAFAGLAGVLAVLLPIDTMLRANHVAALPGWVLLAVLVSVALELLLRVVGGGKLLTYLLAGVAIVAAGVGIALLVPRAPNLMRRLSQFSQSDASLVARFLTYREAITAWRTESPLLGLGGGGWRAVYAKYQTTTFVSREVHSGPIDALVELGIQGAFLLLAAWAVGLWKGFKSYWQSNDPRAKMMFSGVVIGLVALMAHAALDFDLWYPAFTAFLYVGLGIVRAVHPTTEPLPKGRRPAQEARYAVIGVLVVSLAGVLPLTAAAFASDRGVRQYAAGQSIDVVRSSFATAANLDPISGVGHEQYGDLLIQLGLRNKSKADVDEGRRQLELAIKREPYNYIYPEQLSGYLEDMNEVDRALQLSDQAIGLAPTKVELYDQAMRQALRLMGENLGSNHVDAAKSYLAHLKAEMDGFGKAQARSAASVFQDHVMAPDPLYNLLTAQYLAYAGKWADAQALLLKSIPPVDTDKATAEQYLLWTAAVAQLTPDGAVAKKATDDLAKLNPNLTNQVAPVIKSIQQAKVLR